MAKKISELSELTSVADNDYLPIVDVSTSPISTKRITRENLLGVTGDVVDTDTAQSLSNKDFEDSSTTFHDNTTTTKKMRFELSGVTAGQTRVLTVPDSDFTFATTSTAQLLSNKTLEDLTTEFVDNSDNAKKARFELSGISTGNTRVMTVPDSDFTIVGTDLTQTLSNKTIVLKQGASAAPTAEGDIQWDTDDDRIAVGDGSSTRYFYSDIRVKAKAYQSANQENLTNATDTKLTLNTESYDTGSNFDNATNYRFTIPVSGHYLVVAKLRWLASSTQPGNYICYIFKNGSQHVIDQVYLGTAGKAVSHSICMVDDFAATNYLEMYARVDLDTPANTVDINAGETETFFEVTLLSRSS